MPIKAEYKRKILDDFEYAAKMMRTSDSIETKLFYFSSTFGVLSRVFNFSFDAHLVFMHLLLVNAHSNISSRLNALRGGEKTVEFPDDYFDKLAQMVEELADCYRNNKDTYPVLERIALLAFITTGNGYYLFKKGDLMI